MNVQEYINSGILEEYCTGMLNNEEQAFVLQMCMLYPEVKEELTRIEIALEGIARANAINPNPALKQAIFDLLGFGLSSNDVNLKNLPPLSANTDIEFWISALKQLIPDNPTEDIVCNVLRQDNTITQTLVVSRIHIPQETHQNVIESFLILEGECQCTIGNDVFRLTSGDFIEIPLHVEHDVKLLSPYVVAILQHQGV